MLYLVFVYGEKLVSPDVHCVCDGQTFGNFPLWSRGGRGGRGGSHRGGYRNSYGGAYGGGRGAGYGRARGTAQSTTAIK